MRRLAMLKRKIIASILVFVLLSSVLIVAIISDNSNQAEENFKINFSDNKNFFEPSNEGTLVDSSEKISLFANQGGNVTVKLNETNQTFTTSILNQNILNKISNKEEAVSPVVLSFLRSQQETTIINSKVEATDRNQCKMYIDNKKLVVEFIFNEFADQILLPYAIEKKRFESLIMPKLEVSEQNQLKRRYILKTYKDIVGTDDEKEIIKKVPGIRTREFYILTDASSEAKKTMIAELLSKANYTLEQQKEDEKLSGFVNSQYSNNIKLVIQYYIKDDELEVCIDTKDVIFSKSNPLLEISLMKYMSFSTNEQDGYYFVPDGSGGLFDFKNNNNKVEYTASMHGIDYTLPKKASQINRLSAPVFGEVKNNFGYLCMVEQGFETGLLNLQTTPEGYLLYPSFVITDFAQLKMGSKDYYKTAPKSYNGRIILDYAFFENANYSTFANYYQKKLFKNNQPKQSQSIVSLEFINSIEENSSILNVIPTKKQVALTTFEQTEEIINFFDKSGIKNIDVSLLGWNEHGLYKQSPKKIEISNVSGSNEKFKSLVNNYNCYSYVNLAFYYSKRLFDGYSKSKYNARMLNNEFATINIVDKITNAKIQGLEPIEIVSPSQYQQFAENYIKHSKTFGNKINVGEFASNFVYDFNLKNPVTRNDSLKIIKDVLSNFIKNNMILSASNPNIEFAPYFNMIYDIKTQCNRKDIFEKSVPFIQMVLKGFVPYTTTSINNSSDIEFDLLKAVETGSNLKFVLANKIDKNIMKTEYDYLFNIDFNLTKTNIFQSYEKTKDVLNKINNVPIKSHEYVDDYLTKTQYQNGTVVYVNYSTNSKKINDLSIGPRSFQIIGE